MKTCFKLLIFLVLILLLPSCQRSTIEYYGQKGLVTYDMAEILADKVDKYFWQKTTKQNTLAAYTAYLNQYPEGAFASEAKGLITSTEVYLLEAGLKPSDYLFTDLEEIYTMKASRQDVDKDGVADYKDIELDTPAGYPVDRQGKALDKDKDGVPDGRDAEPNSPLGFEVDTKGVAQIPSAETVTKEEIERAIAREDLNFLSQYLSSHEPDAKYYNWVEKAYGDLSGPVGTDGGTGGSAPGSGSESVDIAALWAVLKERDNIAALQDFYETYPDSPYAALAKNRVVELLRIEPENEEDPDLFEVPPPPRPSSIIVAPPVDSTSIVPEEKEDTCLVKEMITDGVLAFKTLPAKMTKDEIYEFHLKINDLSQVAKVVKEMEELTGEDIDLDRIDIVNGDTINDDVIIEKIKIGEEMKIRLEAFDQEAFKIKPRHSSPTQTVDCQLTASWDWDIQPLKKGEYRLQLIVEIVKNGKPHATNFSPKPRIIEVEVETSLLTQLAIPGAGLLLFIFGFLVYRRRKRKTAVFGTAAGLASMPAPDGTPKSIFIAYAPEDEEWTTRIYNQLKTLSKSGYVNIWYDKMIEGGEDYRAEIFEHLDDADLIFLNVSSDFLASDFCDTIVQRAMARVDKGEDCQILPIIIRPCLWTASPIAKYPVFPKNQMPLSDKDWEDEDNAIYQVMKEMEEELLE